MRVSGRLPSSRHVKRDLGTNWAPVFRHPLSALAGRVTHRTPLGVTHRTPLATDPSALALGAGAIVTRAGAIATKKAVNAATNSHKLFSLLTRNAKRIRHSP